jgi:hypothetical protein
MDLLMKAAIQNIFGKPDPEDQSNIALNTEAQGIWIRLLWMLI